jgi:hypothetical protein
MIKININLHGSTVCNIEAGNISDMDYVLGCFFEGVGLCSGNIRGQVEALFSNNEYQFIFAEHLITRV